MMLNNNADNLNPTTVTSCAGRERKVSFLIPAFNEEESIPELYRQVMENIHTCEEAGLMTDYEFLFVNDGSTDGTADAIRELHRNDPKVRYLFLRKNFGKSVALQAGFRNVTGDVVITMDADLQDDPCELRHFLEKLDEGYDLVSGWKFNRLDPAEKRLPSKLFNKVTATMSGIALHDFDCGYKAYRREVSDALDLYGSMHRYIPVLAWRHGYRIAEIQVHHNKRKYGKSKYGMERYLQGLFDFLTMFFLTRYADRPMYFFGRVGLVSGCIGFAICFYLMVLWFCGEAIGKRPLLTLGVLLIMLGMQFMSVGFIGNMIVDQNTRRNYNESNVLERSERKA
jgi:glycosyltransferase involved in cell wall biosynthesis